jgi:DNA-binding HxlR family transcriptional regulator
MQQTQSSPLKQRHTDILLLLYRFRFLTRQHIQALLNHKNHRKVIQWLNELSKLGYIDKREQSSVIESAVYSLSKLSRKYLKDNQLIKHPAQLDRVWREGSYTRAFQDKCVLVADIYLSLLQTGGALRFWSKTDLYGIEGLVKPPPDAYFILKTKRYFLDAFTVAPGKVLRGRVQRYAEYFAGGEWQETAKAEFPEVILLCPSRPSAKSLSRYIREEYSDEPDLHFFVSSDRTLKKLL